MADRAMDRKWVAEPYDMDTAQGANNSGTLMFGYSLEDTDTVSSVISGSTDGSREGQVFNAQDSTLWNNMRDAFYDEISTMYGNLRAGDKEHGSYWNYNYIKTWFENHQSKWPEAIFNEDGRTKYLAPLISPAVVYGEDGKPIAEDKATSTDRYLEMLQGSKAEQRKWWLYNRFRYMDSKYNTGDASKTINMRLFNDGTLTITAAIDLYVGVSFGGGSTPILKRTSAETPVDFVYTAPSGVHEMETWIYSADLITDVGDLSIFYPNELDFSKATRLRRQQIGSAAPGYSNTNLVKLDVRNSSLLEYLDVRNCSELKIPINLEGSPRLKEAYFDGTAVTVVNLADGAIIEKLHLPNTITSLVLVNLTKLQDLQLAGQSNIKTLIVSNIDSTVFDPVDALDEIPANSQVYFDGLDLEMANAAEIEAFFDKLDTMRGVTRERGTNGDWMYHDHDTAQVSGKIHTGSLTGSEIAAFNARYPYIKVTADHTTSYIYYHNWEEDSAIIHTETVMDGGDGSWDGSTTHAATPANTFTFIGWSRNARATSADVNAQKGIVADRHLYAAYRLTGQVYTVTFSNPYNSADNATVNNVPYGGSANYPKSTTPTYSGNNEMVFKGWSPQPTNIQGNLTCIAQFVDMSSPVIKYLKGTLKSYESPSNNKIGKYGLAYQYSLKTITAPITTIESNAFSNTDNIETIDFTGTSPVAISGSTFGSKTKLTAVIIRSTSMSTLYDVNAFDTTPIAAFNGAIYVPGSILSTYKANENWSNFSVLPIDSYPATDFSTIYDSWETIISNINSGNISNYPIGSLKKISFGSSDYYLQLVGTDKDVLASDNTTTVKTTWAFATKIADHRMNATSTNENGYPATEMYTWLAEQRANLPDIIKNNLKTVKKTYYDHTTKSTLSVNTDFWLFSSKEIFNGGPPIEDSGCVYDQFFTSKSNRVKRDASGSTSSWWLRSAYSNSNSFLSVYFDGYANSSTVNISYGVVPGLCL